MSEKFKFEGSEDPEKERRAKLAGQEELARLTGTWADEEIDHELNMVEHDARIEAADAQAALGALDEYFAFRHHAESLVLDDVEDEIEEGTDDDLAALVLESLADFKEKYPGEVSDNRKLGAIRDFLARKLAENQEIIDAGAGEPPEGGRT